MSDKLPAKEKAKRNSKGMKEPNVSKQNIRKYDVKIVAPLTIENKPVVAICETNAPKGIYFLQNINDVMIRMRLKVDPQWLVIGEGRLEVCVQNLEPHSTFSVEEGTVVGRVVKP
jgi:hypothetical protein